jgi:superfamily II DNA/RNA helicase
MGGGLSVGVIMGGVPRKAEEIKISKGKIFIIGINMLVATPGRLLDHL